MKKIIPTLSLLLLLITIFSACGHADHKQELTVLDSLQSTLTESVNLLDQVNLDQIRAKQSLALQDIDSARIRLTDSKVSISPEDAIFFGSYQSSVPSMEEYSNLKSKLSQEITKAQNQVKNLRHDVQKNLVPEEKLKSYIETEQKAVSSLAESTRNLKSMADDFLNKYSSLHAEFEQKMAAINMKARKR